MKPKYSARLLTVAAIAPATLIPAIAYFAPKTPIEVLGLSAEFWTGALIGALIGFQLLALATLLRGNSACC